jgi:hypothetical protein
MVRGFLALLIGATLAAGCADATAEPQPPVGPARDAAVLTAVITSVADLPSEPEVLPVVYAVGVQGTIDIGVQAAVASSLVEVCDLRFADDPSEAFEEIDGELVVRVGAVLLVIGPVPLDGDEIEVAVSRQLSGADKEDLVVNVVRRDMEWLVTDVTDVSTVASETNQA